MKDTKIKLRNKVLIFAVALMIFYMLILLFLCERIFHIHSLHNFLIGMLFLVLDSVFLMILVFIPAVKEKMDQAFHQRLLYGAAAYLVFIEVFNLIGMVFIKPSVFTFVHILVFLIYSFGFWFLYLSGKKGEN